MDEWGSEQEDQMENRKESGYEVGNIGDTAKIKGRFKGTMET